jgi:hypothetical protein
MFCYFTVDKILKGFTELLFMNLLLFPKETEHNLRENGSFTGNYYQEPNSIHWTPLNVIMLNAIIRLIQLI